MEKIDNNKLILFGAEKSKDHLSDNSSAAVVMKWFLLMSTNLLLMN